MGHLKDIKAKNKLARSLSEFGLNFETDSSQTSIETIQILQRWMNIHVNISRRIANLESTDSILSTIVQLAQRFLRTDIAAILLWNESKTTLDVKYLAYPKEVRVIEDLHENCELLQRLLHTCRAVRYPDDIPLCHEDLTINGSTYASGLIVPLFMDSVAVGGLIVADSRYQKFNVIDLMGCRSLAEQAVIALEHGMMKSRLQSIAVLEERSRIAREMHDSVVQILGYLSLELYSIEALVKQADFETAISELAQARKNVKNAQAEARENILCLRTTFGDHDDLSDLLYKYFVEFGHVTGIKVHWQSAFSEPLKLSPFAELQLLRIVQEALTNVRKHANADQVWLSLKKDKGDLLMHLKDNGVGFSPCENVLHFGLQTMHERAMNVDGNLTVESSKNQGTSLELRLPLC